MKNKFLKGLVASFALAISGFANAGLISVDDWEVVAISGDWYGATSGWSLGGIPTLSQFDNIMSDGYTHYASDFSSPVNGYESALENSFIDIQFSKDFDFTNLELWITRQWYGTTTIDVSNDTGLVSSSTMQDYGLTGRYSSIPVAMANISYSALYTDLLRIEFGNNDNSGVTILHELAFYGEESTQVSVPEPSTLAIFALGLMGLVSRKFKKQA